MPMCTKFKMWSQNLCRICGQISETCHFIYNVDVGSVIEKKIRKCLNLNLFKNDYKPKQICNNCLVKLNDFSEFIDISQHTNLKFDSIYCNVNWNSRKSPTPNCEYTLPKQSVIVANRQALNDLGHADGDFKKNPSNELNNFNVANCNLNGDEMIDLVNCDNFNCMQYSNQTVVGESGSSENLRNTPSNLVLGEKPEDNSPLSNLDDNSPSPTATKTPDDVTTPKSNAAKKAVISVESVRKSLRLPSAPKIVARVKKTPHKLYSCPHCDRNFMRRGSLNAHIAVHTKVKPFTCEDCSKTFAVKSDLTTHKKSHGDQHKCKYCAKKFTVPSKLKRHVRIHTNERPFVCNFLHCLKAFSDKRNLAGHLATHFADKNFACTLCGKRFITKSRLKQHSKCHTCTVMFKCDLCSKKYKYKTNLINHIKKHNNICPYCKKNCESNTVLVDHLKYCKVRK